VQLGKDLFFIPDFIHDFCDDNNHHTYRGSLKRHIAVEKALFFLMDILMRVCDVWSLREDSFSLYNLLMIPIEIGLGLNCNFPSRDVALYAAWSLRKGYYEYIGEAKN